jgi:hypothetical protein
MNEERKRSRIDCEDFNFLGEERERQRGQESDEGRIKRRRRRQNKSNVMLW